MPWPHDLHAPTNPNSPEEVGWCDRCYRKFPLSQLRFQYDYRGNSLQNLGIRVCPDDYDAPADQLRPVIIRGPEGVVRNPRPPSYDQNFAGGTAAPTSASPVYIDGTALPGPVGTQMLLDDDIDEPLAGDPDVP